MIKIVKGSYGLRRGMFVEAIHAGNTIEIDKDKEERLVRLGVAVYVDNGVAAETTTEAFAETQDEVVDELPEYNEAMKLSDLKEIAEAYGVDASSMRSKKEVIEAIDAAKALPAFDAADAVE